MKVNSKSISRLSRYRDVLFRFKSYGTSWIYSEQIASTLGNTSAQVRKDFSSFKLSGKRKSGYRVDALIDDLNGILGKKEQTKTIIAGNGLFGRALYKEYFSKDPAIQVVGLFDEKITKEEPAGEAPPALPFSSMVKFIRDNKIPFGIIALSDSKGQHILDRMVLAGIKGFLIISPIEIKVPKSCTAVVINPLREFEKVIFFAGHATPKRKALHSASE